MGERLELIERERRHGKAENDSLLLERSRGEFCLLLNEDTELCPGAVGEFVAAVRTDAEGGCGWRDAPGSRRERAPSAWRLPGVGTSLTGALFLHRLFVAQSGRGKGVRRVGWVQSAAMLVRRSAAAEVGYLDPEFFVYSDETDFCKRLRDADWEILYVPGAVAVHHEQLTNDRAARRPRARRVPSQPRPLHAKAPRSRSGGDRARALRVGLRSPGSVAVVRPGSTPAGSGCRRKLAWSPSGKGIRELGRGAQSVSSPSNEILAAWELERLI